jgi:Porin subfamily
MKMVKSLLLGSAAGVVAVAGAQAADLPVKAKPVQYVKICSLYGAGFYYIPGTDTCIKIGGFVRAEVNFNAGGSFGALYEHNFDDRGQDNRQYWRVRGGVTFDARTQTEFGTLRSYILGSWQDNNSNAVGGSPYLAGHDAFANAIFIQWAGFTAGKTASFFDFDGQPYSNQSNVWGSNQGGNGIPLFAYTAQFGNGVSASVSLENSIARRSAILGPTTSGSATHVNPTSTVSGVVHGSITTSTSHTTGGAYAKQGWPDIVGNLRIDQSWGSAQVMGALHDVTATYYSAGSSAHPGDKVGWAIGAGLKLNLPMTGVGDYAIAQFTYSKGAVNYAGSDYGAGGTAYFNVQKGFPTVTSTGLGPVYDATFGVGTGLDLTTAWSITGGYEHHWNPQWKTSLYGAYGEVRYSAASSARIANNYYGSTSPTGSGAGSANWSFWQIGSRTVWTPVANLDLSVEVMYNKLNTAFAGATTNSGGTFKNQDWVSGIFRVQRNFYP